MDWGFVKYDPKDTRSAFFGNLDGEAFSLLRDESPQFPSEYLVGHCHLSGEVSKKKERGKKKST